MGYLLSTGYGCPCGTDSVDVINKHLSTLRDGPRRSGLSGTVNRSLKMGNQCINISPVITMLCHRFARSFCHWFEQLRLSAWLFNICCPPASLGFLQMPKGGG